LKDRTQKLHAGSAREDAQMAHHTLLIAVHGNLFTRAYAEAAADEAAASGHPVDLPLQVHRGADAECNYVIILASIGERTHAEK
jgi:hypothetical protein